MNKPIENRNRKLVRRIRMTKVKDKLRRMKTGKAVGPNKFPWKFKSAWVTWVYAS